MNVQEVIDIAKYSELNNLSVKDNNEAIVSFMNLGMIELYTRFPIKTEEYSTALVEDQSVYDLPNNFMYALSVYSDTGTDGELEEYPINDTSNAYSVTFPDWKTVQVPDTITGSLITIIYVAKPTTISVDSLTSSIDLPDTLVDALVSYIGYRGNLGIRGDAQSEGASHWQRFERNCKKARELGVAFPIDKLDMSTRINARGFV